MNTETWSQKLIHWKTLWKTHDVIPSSYFITKNNNEIK